MAETSERNRGGRQRGQTVPFRTHCGEHFRKREPVNQPNNTSRTGSRMNRPSQRPAQEDSDMMMENVGDDR